MYNEIGLKKKKRKVDNMLAKYWKKIGLLILIIACVFNIMGKLINKVSLNKEMISSAMYVVQEQKNEVIKNKAEK